MRNRLGFVFSLCILGFVSYSGLLRTAEARDRWTQLNIGPFYVATDGDVNTAREALTQLEQLRWVLGGLLESKDLPSLWPIHVLLTDSEKTNPNQFVWKNGVYIFVLPHGAPLPLNQIAGLLIDANTPRLPAEIESGLRELCSTIQAKGSRVTWGGPPAHPDLAFARMQLFATKFEYTLSFHILLTALKGNTDLAAAERNAFGKDPHLLEQEASAALAAGNWQPVAVSGRPLDPKRDFGEHSLDESVAAVYVADFSLGPEAAEAAYKTAIQAGGVARALGYEGLAGLAALEHQNPKEFFDDAIKAGSKSAPVFVGAADGLDPAEALPLLKRAIQLNPLWAEPIYQQAQLASDPGEKLKLLKEATRLDPRQTKYWIELAQFETAQGDATAAQGTWLRAEDSAPNDAERARVHQMRVDSEQERLDAAEDARRRDREAVHLADERAQQNEADRIRAAEEKANKALDSASTADDPQNAVPWNQLVPQKKLQGSLLRVDCLGSNARLTIKDKAGARLQLLLKQASEAGLTCGAQQPARHVSLTYAAEPDDRFHTSGNIVDLQVR